MFRDLTLWTESKVQRYMFFKLFFKQHIAHLIITISILILNIETLTDHILTHLLIMINK